MAPFEIGLSFHINFVAYLMQITKQRLKHVTAIKLEKYPRSKVCSTNAFFGSKPFELI